MENSIDRKSKSGIIIAILVILLPAIQAGVIALFSFCKYKSGLSVPMWNDEAVYYALIKTWITPGAHGAFGNPIGYYGFNGGHAILGTGSGWSPAIIFPYAVFAKMFGLNYHTIWAANLVFMTLGNALFILIAKPDMKAKIRLLILSAFSTPVILYAGTQMSEPLRYALVMVLAACIYRLLSAKEGEVGPVFAYVIVPLYLIFLVQIYIFYVFAVPIYIFAVLKKQKVLIKTIVAFLATVVVGGGSYYLLHLISSNYNTYKPERLLDALKSGDILGTVKAAVSLVKEGLTDWFNLARYGACHGLLTWFTALVAGIFIICIIGIIKSEKGSYDKAAFIGGIASLVIFTGAFITMYSLDPNTFFRSNCIVVLFVLYLIALTDNKPLFIGTAALFAMGALFIPFNIGDYVGPERVMNSEVKEEWDNLASDFDEVFELSDSDNPWDSTVVVFTLEPKVLTSIKAGMGVNMMLQGDMIPEEAAYLLFTKHEDNLRSDWLEKKYEDIYEANSDLIDNNYKPVFENEDYLILKKNK
ncbi:MAG: hypothetical protein J5537_05485 [Lachnospiraceae bacterium]|nr:hypothetical protein [Lachnospiraceae bacterium]